MRVFARGFVLLAALCGIVTASKAAFFFNYITVVSGDTPTGGPVFARLDVWDVAPNTVGMRLTHSSTAQPGQFALSVRLNLSPLVPSITITDTPVVDPLYRPLDNYSYSPDGINAPMGTRFDLEVAFTTANNGNRVGPGDFANWTVTGTGLTSNSFFTTANVGQPWYSVVRILGIPPAGGSSWVAADPVPEPATVLALGAGLAALMARRRRKA